MSDDPYPSLQPVVTAITGFCIATFTIFLPLTVIGSEGVKSPHKDTTTKAETTQAPTVKFH